MAEFAMVLPLLLIFLLGMIDVGRMMWTWNRVEKATQMGVRYAVATDMVPTGLQNYSFAVDGGLPQGDPIPASAFATVSCTSTGCTCTASSCKSAWTSSANTNTTAFNNVVARMQLVSSQITPASVQIDYDYSGLGYAGDPNGSDVSPLVRVSIRPDTLNFRPILFSLFKTATIPLPPFSAALTMEDGQGSVSN
ncbi:MAG TPA: TadE family protein [Sphingobium sp.]|nr:TadE family protein [Sphingobium sp.]